MTPLFSPQTPDDAAHPPPEEPDVRLDANRGDDARAGLLTRVSTELKLHVPFTMAGTLTGVVIMVAFIVLDVPRTISVTLFWSLHPLHVLLSALVTTAMFTVHGRRVLWATIVVGYLGSVGIATLSDCIIPYLAETLLDLPHRGIHLGFIEKWWLVNPLAAVGIFLGCLWPHTRSCPCGTCSVEHMGFLVPHDDGDGSQLWRPGVRGADRLLVFGRVGSLLHERYRVPVALRQEEIACPILISSTAARPPTQR